VTAPGRSRRRGRTKLARMPDTLTAGCLCGAVRFEVTEPPTVAYYCHCTRCQRRTGTAAAHGARVPPGAVRVVSGEDKIRRYVPAQGLPKAFCGDCGSALWAETRDDGEVAAVRMGVFDADPGIRPSYRQFTAYAAAWEPIPDDGLPRYPERAA
jgi:hypothetical protein